MKTDSEENRTTVLGLYNYGISYWHAAKSLTLSKEASTHPEAPKTQLYFITIELLLKSYLRSKGLRLSELRNHSHRLDKLHSKAKEFGLDLNEKSIFVINFLSNQNTIIRSRYIITEYTQRLSFDDLDDTVKNIIEMHPQT